MRPPITDLFLARAARTPDAAAIISESRVTSFAELAHGASRVASALRSHNLGPESLIAVCAGRSHELPTCLLGILLAGCAYLPIDTRQPPLRTAQILAEARPALVVADDEARPGLTNYRGDVQYIHDLLSYPAQEQSGVTPIIHDDQLAYVIFTSGSTGNPKGVEISHRAAVNTLQGVNRICSIRPEDRVLSIAPLSFDLSVYDLFGAWAAGAAVVLTRETPYADPGDWITLMRQVRISIWNSAPAILELLLERLSRKPEMVSLCLRDLRIVMLSGDRISPSLVRQLQSLQPAARVLAMGGATEASIWSVYHWTETLAAQSRFVPYGRALPNQHIVVLDRNLDEVPVEKSGELFIGGVGLARGYRGRPDLTAAAFVADPRGDGTRLYATGDSVRRLEDGNTEFLGRHDGQIKIRGFRVEIAEVEKALLAIGSIAQAAVVCRPSTDGNRVCAYLVPCNGAIRLDTATLRGQLSNVLPSYMIPGHFRFISRMPLTANGKVDRDRLNNGELPDHWNSRSHTDVTADSQLSFATLTASTVAAVWREVLKLEHIRPDEHFLDIGGNSVMAAQILNRVAETFGIATATRDIFENPTITALSVLVDERLA